MSALAQPQPQPQRPLPTPAQPDRWAYMRLMRPANVATAVADVAAGAAVAGAFWGPGWLPLALAGAALYAGGVTLNDVCDRDLDAVERPDRPLPRGTAEVDTARGLAYGLLAFGVVLAWAVGLWSGAIALLVAGLAIAYDTRLKRHPWLGPAAMGGCRAFNLLLGVSAAPLALAGAWPLALVPLAYVAAITLVSRGEVTGGDGRAEAIALALMGAVVATLVGLGPLVGAGVIGLPFVALLALRVIPAYRETLRRPHPLVIRRAVKAGVISVVCLNAAIAATFAGPAAGLAVLALWPVSAGLARAFAVT